VLVELVRERQSMHAAAGAVRRDYPTLTIQTLQEHEPAAIALLEITGSAALTVIASQAKHQALETLMGSVATYIAEQGKGPVVVLRGDASSVSGTGPVVLGVDGSAASESAVDFAFEAARSRGVPLLAVHTWDSSPVQGFRRTFHLHVDHDQADGEQLAELTSALAEHSERHPGITVQPTVRRGHPRRVLIDVAREQHASLLVVGAVGVGTADEQELGSTSRGLLAHADVPLAVVRHVVAG
jgi:nucleotide-binding universal stress UspA family protein